MTISIHANMLETEISGRSGKTKCRLPEFKKHKKLITECGSGSELYNQRNYLIDNHIDSILQNNPNPAKKLQSRSTRKIVEKLDTHDEFRSKT